MEVDASNPREDRTVPSPLTSSVATSQLPLLRALFMDAPVGFGMLDTAFRLAVINRHLATTLGISLSDHLGQQAAEIVPDFWPMLEPLVEAVRRDGIPVVREADGVPSRSTGHATRWRVMAYPVREDGTGAAIGIGFGVKDITEDMQQRDALHVRTDLYAMISRTNRAVIECRSREALFDELCRIAVETGHFRFAWIGVPVSGHLHAATWAGEGHAHLPDISISGDDARATLLGPTGQAFVSGQCVVVNDFLRSAATEHWHELAVRAGFASVAALPLKERGRIVAVLTLRSERAGFFTRELVETLNEITPAVSLALDAFLREEDLRRDHAELHLRDRAIRATPHGICISDARLHDNPLIFVSQGFERITGYTAEESIGRNCRFLQGKETEPSAVAVVRTAIAHAQSCTIEFLNYRKDRTTFLNQLTVSPVFDDDGSLTNYIGVISDVTERRQLELQIQKVQKMEAMGQLASGVAHDFNNVLTVIDGCGDLLLDMATLDDTARELVQEILKAGTHGGTLTRQLLAFSRKQVVAPKVLDLNVVVGESEKMLHRLIGEDVLLTTHLHSPLWPVRCDPGQIEQVLINLAVNARDAMPNGGQLTVSTGIETVSNAGGEHPLGDYVTLEVRDSGMGMDEYVRQQMFEPFFTTKLPGRGTGLGLSTVHGIVVRSGGHIVVESELGEGSTFRLYFPRSEAAAEEDPSLAHVGGVQGGTETVLLAEDDAAVRALGHRILVRCGYTVLEAGDGREALAIVRSHDAPIHLLVTDVVMPHLGGRELAMAIAHLRPECRTLFLSGYTNDEVVRHGVVESEVAFLQKPFSAAAFAQKVRSVLDGRP